MAPLTADDQTTRMLALREELLTSLRPFITGAPGSSPLTDAAIEAFKVKTLPIIQQQMLLKGLGHSPAVSQVTGETLALALPEFLNADLVNRLNATNQAAGLIGTENQVFGTQGQLALGGRAQTLAETIQPGQLTVAQAQQRLAEEIQRGQLGLAGRETALREAIEPRRIALEETVGTGQLGQSGAKLSADIAHQEALRQLEGFRTAGQLQLGLGDLGIRTGQLQQGQQQLALQAGQGAGGLQRDIAQAVADARQAERLRVQGLSEGGSFGIFGGNVIPPSLQQASRTTGSSSK